MTTYTKRPTQVEALRFTGGGESAQTIALGLVEAGISTTWITSHSTFSLNEVREIEETQVPEVLRFENAFNERVEAQVGQWVTLLSDNNVMVLDDAEFNKLYIATA
jgi:cation diffusion facilitator CzcD-associated flavoprotein CzcO